MQISGVIEISGMADEAAAARVFRRGDFSRGRWTRQFQKPLASEEASYNTYGARFVG
jgi:hypothetical protein